MNDSRRDEAAHDTPDGPGAGEAMYIGWRALAATGDRLAERILGSEFPETAVDRSNGYFHLAGQLACWVGWSVLYDDARRPRFQRQNDLGTMWGGPNADNVYRHARISADRRYRITGKMHSCEEFILAIRAGFMHEDTWGTLHEVSATDLGIAEGQEFTLVLGNGPDDDVPLPEGAVMATFREYYYDWRPQEPATMVIECIDDDVDAPGEPVAAERRGEQFRRAASGLEHSVENWNRYLVERRAEGADNRFGEVRKIAKGLDSARYQFCFWNLQPGDALVVTSSVPESRYWSFQLYNMGAFDLVEPTERQIALNHRQARIDTDGRVRVVVSHEDPGVANWLDPGGRRVGLMTYRFFWPYGTDPEVSTHLTRSDRVAAELANTSPMVTTDERRAEIRSRRAHLSWRFRE